eukprot:TRINITY_DN2937_c1_g1_i2.p6 TRINITY_DN2937_c1_g1~~TRINITY_DN2937_c1_g1_i2.p6  ORF type:complete len:189 (-),score=18.20 TRINITY_DN2937_c1_g1_i2:2246-2812(-)
MFAGEDTSLNFGSTMRRLVRPINSQYLHDSARSHSDDNSVLGSAMRMYESSISSTDGLRENSLSPRFLLQPNSTKRVTFDELIMLLVDGTPPIAIPRLNLTGLKSCYAARVSSSISSGGSHSRSTPTPRIRDLPTTRGLSDEMHVTSKEQDCACGFGVWNIWALTYGCILCIVFLLGLWVAGLNIQKH